MATYDLVIRNGNIVDGTGRPGFNGDVAILGGIITAVGEVDGDGVTEIDAAGQLVTPGFVDIHTHYDGHVTWTQRLGPSSDHGVTTVVMGNCGVGFAPCKPEDRERLVHLMEGVEDIPEIVMTAGLPWNWQSFPDYLDRLADRQFDMDIAAYLPHAPLRVFVMKERAAAREPATTEDIAKMRALAREAVEVGALGFSSSRSLNHKASDGTVTPTYASGADELAGIASGLKDAGKGVLQIISDFDDVEAEFGILRRMVEESGRPLSTTVLQTHHAPDRWRDVLHRIGKANDEGLPIKAQIASRAGGAMFGLNLSRNPFMRTPSYREIADLPLDQRVLAMRDAGRRARILSEMPGDVNAIDRQSIVNFPNIYDFDEDGYEPAPGRSMAQRAAAAGIDVAEFTYDLMSSGSGDKVFFFPAVNFVGNTTAAVEEMMAHQDTVMALGDGGAHCGLVCDASLTTFLLERWSEIGNGDMPIERAIQRLTSEPASTVGLNDRGVIATGYRADINIIDPRRVSVGRPEVVHDLPDGAGRLGQKATGYVATMVAGEITYREGEKTSALPGRLVRGAQPMPGGAR